MSSLIPVYEQNAMSAEPQVSSKPQLISASSQDDAAEFDVLVLRYRRRVLAFVSRITGSMVEAEDLTQQALMKAFVNYSSFAGRSSFSTWLISIARNEALMWCRKTRRSREIAMAELATGESSESHPDFMDSRPDPEITCLQKERSRLLFSELKKLKPATREALELCDLDEQSAREAAVMLGISAIGLKSRRFRGRAMLRQRLEPKLLPSKSRLMADACLLRSSVHNQEDEMNLR
jgi:RNA polymerase sigma-70 factor, ECF subfamily